MRSARSIYELTQVTKYPSFWVREASDEITRYNDSAIRQHRHVAKLLIHTVFIKNAKACTAERMIRGSIRQKSSSDHTQIIVNHSQSSVSADDDRTVDSRCTTPPFQAMRDEVGEQRLAVIEDEIVGTFGCEYRNQSM